MKYLAELKPIQFPKPTGTIINMMPFIMGDDESTPSEYKQYKHLIDACNLPASEIGKIGFLTVHESYVQKSASQRRGGIHTEKHPSAGWGGGWGGGKNSDVILGGLYMASTVNNSCVAWDQYVKEPKEHGNCEHLRPILGDGIKMKKDFLYWMTDGTPHEALPLTEDCHRQFFRLVTSEVGLWYAAHSTANRLGIIPTCEIIKANKFKTNN